MADDQPFEKTWTAVVRLSGIEYGEDLGLLTSLVDVALSTPIGDMLHPFEAPQLQPYGGETPGVVFTFSFLDERAVAPVSPASSPSPAKQRAPRKAATKKATVKKAGAKKAGAPKRSAKKTPAKRIAANKTSVRKASPKKQAAKKTSTRKGTGMQTTATQRTAKKSARRAR